MPGRRAAPPGPHDRREWTETARHGAQRPLLAIMPAELSRSGPPMEPLLHPDAVYLDDLVARQAGVVARSQALELGMSQRTVARRVASGAWEQVHRNVYLVGGHRVTDEARVRAAWLWAGGKPAVVTGPAAAYWHGVHDRAPAGIEVTVPRSMRPRPPAGVVVRHRDLTPVDQSSIRGLRVADRPFAALETAVALPDGSAFLDRALQRHVRFPAVYRACCRNLGRQGSAEAGRLITAAADRADSAAERLLMGILRGGGVTGWVVGHPFGPYLVDLAFRVRRWPSRWTDGPGTSTRCGSGPTVARATSSRGPAGACSVSPGTTSTAGRPDAWPRSWRHWPWRREPGAKTPRAVREPTLRRPEPAIDHDRREWAGPAGCGRS